ncbi:arginine--tRNA ligase [Candidatus Roizmanbacteria bacterium]|nr:arginine--tRNA ligase [Candidatus Roizmanbacteria bacterium]
MEDIKKSLALDIKSAIKDLLGKEITPKLDHPQESFGDYSSNIALVGSKILKTSPLTLAESVKSKLPKMELIEKIEVAKPGFINFWISKKYLIDRLREISEKKDQYGKGESLKNKKIMVEFTDPNPFKEFHIGHLYSNIVGESLSRLLETQGAIVKRANYQGDVGMHVAKALWGLFQLCHAEFSSASKIQENKILKQVQDDSSNKKAKFLGQAYALGARAYEEDEKAKSEIEKLNKKIYEKDPSVMPLYQKGRQWSLEYFEEIYKRLGTKFDYYYFESEVGKEGLELVKEYLKKGVFVESRGAIVFPGEKYGLHTRVFINSLGLPTYEAKELGLALRKYKDSPYGEAIIITGNEIIGYFKVLLAALRQINPDLAQKTVHIAHGMVRLKSGKMSSREGNILTGEWLIDEAKRLIGSQYKEMENDTLEKVAIGAVKYALLKSGIGRNIEFSFDESISFEGNSGPYLQYAYARTQSVLGKLKTQNSKLKITTQNSKVWERLEPEELSILRTLYRFPEVVEEASINFSPNTVCSYLFDLAQKFNLFYQKHQILGSENKDFRLLLTSAVGQILKNGLNLLGIEAPEGM